MAHPVEQNAAFLQKEYGTDGKGFFLGENPYAVWFDGNGFRIAPGRRAQRDARVVSLTWNDAARRIRQLLDMGRFVPQEVSDRADSVEKKSISMGLLYMVRDFTNKGNEDGYMPSIRKILEGRSGFPDMEEELTAHLNDSRYVRELISELDTFITAYEAGYNVLRFRYHRPRELKESLEGLLRETVSFPSPETTGAAQEQFITEDEIDRLLTGGGNIRDSKYRIAAFFLEDHTAKERADFLRKEYGDSSSGSMLKAGYIEGGGRYSTDIGTMQGLMSNVYLNDFDWYVGRMYCEPHPQCKHKCNTVRKLKWSGVTPKYNFRFADDWVIITSTEKEARRLKKHLTKYFQCRLKLELSQEKTTITDMRKEGIHFLGFVVKAERKRKTPDPKTWSNNLVGKPLPDMERLKDKIRKIEDEVRVVGTVTERSVQAAQIHKINSMIVGLAQYLQPSICSKAFHVIDRRINNCALAVWKRQFPRHYNKYQVSLEKLCNLPHRHEGYKSKTFAVPIEGEWYGITMAFITHVKYEAKPFDQRMTPFTEEGRRIYVSYRSKTKPLPCDRPSINTAQDIQLSVYAKTKYNFEYFMNREYAFNRDKGKCKCCKTPLFLEDKMVCAHARKSLPIDKINKVPNLIWLCNNCYRMINKGDIPPNTDAKVVQKIMKYRNM